MWDEKQLRNALREEIEGPAPAVRTQLSDIVPRGLRRRRMRHISAAAAAMAVVVGVGVVVTTLNGSPTSTNEPALPTAATSTTALPEADWSRAYLPPRSPYRTWEPAATAPPPPGRPKLAIPMCSADVPDVTDLRDDPVMAEVRLRLQAGLKAVATSSKLGAVGIAGGDRVQELTVDVSDANGMGSVRVTASSFSGQPVVAADLYAFEKGNCQPPKRKVQPDGTVLQLFSVVPSEPFQSLTQVLMIYRPDGKRIAVTVQNWGSVDVTVDKRTQAYTRTGAGRATLPLTERQLAELGEQLTSK